MDVFGTMPDGRRVQRYTLFNEQGSLVRLISYGATVTELHVRDRAGKVEDVVLGFDSLESYLEKSPYFGCTTGRVANRIAQGRFTLEGVQYQLAANNGPHHLHGGLKGLDKVLWNSQPIHGTEGPGVRFQYQSPDGEEGYPGNLTITVEYTLSHRNELRIEYTAVTDKVTPVNLTHHSYFNLGGRGCKDILGHVLIVLASQYTDFDSTLIPTGKFASVGGGPFDFLLPQPIGARIGEAPGGYDLNYVVSHHPDHRKLSRQAELYEPQSGRVMTVESTEPGLQFYSGNFLDGTLTGKYGVVYGKHSGLCLESQHFPDSVNHPEFPSTILEPGKTYHQLTIYRFSTR